MIGESFLQDLSLWDCLWQSVAFIGLGLVVSYLLRHRPSRAYQVLLFAMIAAIAVPFMSVVVKHFNLGIFAAEAIDSSSSTLKVPMTTLFGEVDIAPEMRTSSATTPIPVDSKPAGILSSVPRISWRSVMLYGWLATTIVLLSRLVVTFIYGAHVIRHAHRKGCEKIQEAADRARSKIQISGVLDVYVSKHVRSPVAWCWTNPPILLVPNACEELSVDWTSVVTHELAHWKRQDHISGFLAEMTICLLPWNPLMWLAKKRLVRLGEEACDDWVIATGQPCEEYAESLLRFRPQRQMAFLPTVVHTEKGLAGRVHRILKDNCANPRAGVMWALIVSIATVCITFGVSFAQTRPVKSQPIAETQAKPLKTLHQAAADGDIEQVKLNLSQGVDINSEDNRRRTALLRAIEGKHSDIVKFLIDHSADINTKNRNQQTPLHIAANIGNKKTVELLLGKGSNIEAKDRFGRTPLFTAMTSTSEDRREIIDLLIDKGAKVPEFHLAACIADMEKLKKRLQDGLDINSQQDIGSTALHIAANAGRKDIVDFLIDKGAKVDAKDNIELTPLYYAAMHNYRDVVDLLIENDADINAKSDGNYTLLYYAIWENKKEPVELLIEKGAKVNIKASDGYSPLVYAIWMDNKELVEALVNKGADVNVEDNEGYTPLFWATVTMRENKDIVKLLTAKGATVASTIHTATATGDIAKIENLIKEGADINAMDKIGWTPLSWTIVMNDPNATEFLISKGADVNSRGKRGMTPLLLACQRGRKDIAEILISKGADVNVRRNDDRTALHIAVARGHKDVAEMLISKGADVNAKANGSQTPLHIAVNQGNIDMVEILIVHKAIVDVRDNAGVTPLGLAEENGHSEIAALLRKHGAKVSKGTGNTPLHQAAMVGNTIKTKSLIAQGADINAKNENGETPLHFAARRGNLEIIELLISSGADIEAKENIYGSAPLLNAAVNGRKEVVALLLEKGANIEVKNSDGLTPLHLTVGYGTTVHTDVIELLIEKGADIESRGYGDGTPFQTAVVVGRKDVAELLLAKGAKVNVVGKYWGNAAHSAMRANGPEMVRWAIEKGVVIPSLHQAAYFGETDKVNSLLNAGADVNQKDQADFTPLLCAVFGKKRDVVELLLRNGANIEARSCGYVTPLFWACKRGHLDMVKVLVEKGARVNSRSRKNLTWGSEVLENWTNLHAATLMGHLDVVEYLLAHGADINAECTFGDKGITPLQSAAWGGHADVIKILLTKGANINHKSEGGRTALDLAKQKNRTQIVELLHKHGAKE